MNVGYLEIKFTKLKLNGFWIKKIKIHRCSEDYCYLYYHSQLPIL